MRYFIKLSYFGKYYNGWQIQKNSESIQGILENRLKILLKQHINIIGASRTDSGVHAKQMFAHFDFDKKIDKNLIFKLNSFLPKYINIYNIYKVKNNAHARFDALSRTYKYFISLGKNPFYKDLSWIWAHGSLSIKKMNQASFLLINNNNFKSFCKKSKNNENYKCKIYKAYWSYNKNFICFTIESNRFIRNMVRCIVGTITDVGKGKREIKDLIRIINSEDRTKAGISAPAKGLFLTKIKYPSNIFL